MNGIRPTYRFKTNIPTEVFFEADEPEVGTGKFGDWYRYDVMIDGRDYVTFASKGLQDKLAKLGHLYGRTITITKKEGPNNRIFWELREGGELLTPETANIEIPEKVVYNAEPEVAAVEDRVAALERRLNTASMVVKTMITRVENLENELQEVKSRTGARAERQEF